ncbi:ATP phosphoribosyltransferase regulatory subunit [Thiomicrorhabdus xiamenensis]|uniref:ATP phosphoribosyltransferase regulatory subunit n=1 Tax=Thiomicrorhabdus xiamenensis TaxID=2739063 RepID=A0A7D4NQD1_9GAMM|nr:ATP phosphoribosyltransferase regulatory subunit [Thiomicrorhabdus xiamenensis]QKI89071.1 ATP phosphoribosyltransferase regulatory subunit [Thiomicrorhabdus xiamenensis]
MQQSTWFTPEGLEDLLPPQAQKLEFYRRQLIDGFHLSGYDLVLPPLAEFTDSLLTGTARHMAIDTCRFTDQESGRMMGVRADMTPQVARIVSNRLKAQGEISRLCYVGEVLKTRNNKAKGSRSPIQVGAEIFGHSGLDSDIEIVELMLESMSRMKLDVKLSLGHVGIVDELIALACLNANQSKDLIDILERKAIPEFNAFVAEHLGDSEWAQRFNQLLAYCGNAQDVIGQANAGFAGLSSAMDDYLNHLQGMIDHLGKMHSVDIHLDLADIRGYQYHTGIIFAAYSACGFLQPIAKGGRYDDIGADFGLALPATGFSLDLRGALDLLEDTDETATQTVYAPCDSDVDLQVAIRQLKQQGIKVIKSYDAGQVPAGSQQLVKENDAWTVK